jgi:hypothetical protein
VLITLFSAAVLGSCAGLNAVYGTTSQTSAPPSASVSPSVSEPDAVSPSPEPSPTSFTFEAQTYSSDGITLRYPQIVDISDGDLQLALNEIIYDKAFMDLDELESGTEYELDYTVSLNTPDVISVWFDGYYYAPGAAHPALLLFAVTIDVKSVQAVTLGDLVTIDSGFAELLRGG